MSSCKTKNKTILLEPEMYMLDHSTSFYPLQELSLCIPTVVHL